MTNTPAPFVTGRLGGETDATVEIWTGDAPGAYRIRAMWTDHGDRREHQERLAGGYDVARTRAREIADKLAIGREP